MNEPLKPFDVAALTADRPQLGLRRGQVGTVVEELAPGVVAVEFSGDDGRAYALAHLAAAEVMALHYRPAVAAG